MDCITENVATAASCTKLHALQRYIGGTLMNASAPARMAIEIHNNKVTARMQIYGEWERR